MNCPYCMIEVRLCHPLDQYLTFPAEWILGPRHIQLDSSTQLADLPRPMFAVDAGWYRSAATPDAWYDDVLVCRVYREDLEVRKVRRIAEPLLASSAFLLPRSTTCPV